MSEGRKEGRKNEWMKEEYLVYSFIAYCLLPSDFFAYCLLKSFVSSLLSQVSFYPSR